ncbi:WhiB family transcriptional regulator [Streptomyces kaniharaensis]|uniref:Transcriptional regulator WhiB n=1 Tax=Streptomyces kaniharaensis TaxID=212423 RepID=A0A6N7L3B8_9ACTN|nr:WhiB family transcriptional regulator [Streptomyces kaniharaensis]MQS16313.1 WhiB family transcriptional regulator [Streptomyces kaniharaensis]
MDRAVCKQDPELFFPIGNRGPALLQIEQAKAVCNRCPVRPECLLRALKTSQETGVWGGVSADELCAIRRRAARARRKA